MDNTTEKTEKKSLTKVIGEGVAMYSAGSIVNKFSGLATSFIKIKFLSVFHYGLLSLTITAVYFFNGLATMGISEVVTADLNRAKGEGKYDVYKALLVGYLKTVTFLSAVFWAILFFGAGWVASFYDNSILSYLQIFSFILLVTPLRTLYTTVFQTHLKFKYLVNMSILESYLNLGLVTVLVWLLGWGIKGVLYAEIIYHLVSLFVFTPFFIKTAGYLAGKKRSPVNFFWRTVRGHGKWAIATNYLGDFTKKIRPWFIAFFLNVEAVAIFSVAQSLFSQLVSLLSINSVLAQIFPQQIKDKIKTGEIFQRSFKYGFYIFTAMGLAGLIFFPWLVDWLFPKYHDALVIFRVLLVSMPIMALTMLQTPIYNAMQKQKEMFFLTVGKNLSMTVLSIIFIPIYGIIGSAFENIITIYFYTIARYLNMKRIASEMSINWKNIFVIDKIDKGVIGKLKNWLIYKN